jgi:predicted exporter
MSLDGRAAILLWLLSLAAAISVIVFTPFTTDMSAFLPKSPDPAQQVLVEQLRDGVASRLILIGLEDGTPQGRAEISRTMAGRLRVQKEFTLVDNGDGGIGTADQDYVWRNRYVLSPKVTPEQFSPDGLRHALDDDLNLLASGLSPLLKDSVARDPTAETMTIVRALAGEGERHVRDGAWISADGKHALILAQTLAPGFDIDAQELALNEIKQAFATARQSDGQVHMLVTGPGIFGVKTRAEMKHDVTLYSTIAMGTIVVLLLLAYRSPLVLLLTMVPVVSGALAGLAAVSLWFGFVHGITIGFGVTLIGEAVDYAIYLLTQTSPQSGPRTTLQRIWPTLRLGVLVSVCGFAAMLFSSFTGFVQLGIFTIAGLATALTVTRFVLPSLLRANFAGTRHVAFAPALLKIVQHAGRWRPILLVLLIVSVAMIASRRNDLWEDELSSMSPVSAADQQLDRNLRHDIGAPDVRQLIVATAPDDETLLQTCERMDAALRPLIKTGVLAGYDSPARYLPSREMQQTRKSALPDRATLERNLAAALAGMPFRPDTFGPFLDAVEAARQAPILTRQSLDGTALALKIDAQLLRDQGRSVAVMPLRNVTDPHRVAEALEDIGKPGVTVKLLDLKTASDSLLHDYRREALLLAFLGSGVIAVLLLIYFRSLRQSLVVLTPLAFAVTATVAMLTTGHHQLSIFNLFGLLLVVAVGSNYCLFFQRGGLVGEEGTRTVTSLLLANICTVVGFGVLGLSGIPVLYGIGSTVAIGTALSLVAGAILAPRHSKAA